MGSWIYYLIAGLKKIKLIYDKDIWIGLKNVPTKRYIILKHS